jgi:hypothetical protein
MSVKIKEIQDAQREHLNHRITFSEFMQIVSDVIKEKY